jgi:two-component system response regulator
MTQGEKTYNVLLIEDNPDHIELISAELMNSNKINKLFISYDGEEALNFLFCSEKMKKEKLEVLDFILLDLKMPKINGFEVLKKVKMHPQFNQIPVIILSTSTSSEDMDRAKSIGAQGYIIKNFSSKQLFEEINKIVYS